MLKYKQATAALIALIFLVGISSTVIPARAGSNTTHVYEGQSIQAAINLAADRSLIIVHEGTYRESLVINKRLSLMSLGAVIDLEGTEFQTAVGINAPGVTFSGFTIQNVPAVQHAGAIHIGGDTSWSGGLIANNRIYSGFYGIVVNAPTNIEIRNNIIYTSVHAIYIVAGSDIIVRGNTVYATQMGISMWGPKASIFNNVIYAGFYGVNVMDCNQADIRNNQIQAGQIGIHLMGSEGTVSHNSVSGDFWSGIAIEADSNTNTVLGNQFTGGNNPGDVGIHLGSETSGNFVTLNQISNVDRKIVDEGIGNIIVTKTGQASATFAGTAMGECIVLVGGVIGPQPPVAVFIGEGTILVSGRATVEEFPPDQNIPVKYYYTPEGAKAAGHLSARWNDQTIDVVLNSKDEACGFFIDEYYLNYFTVGLLPGGPMTPSLSYKGVWRDSTGTHTVSGLGGVIAIPIGDPGNQVMAIGVMLLKPDSTPLLSMLWFPYDVPFGPGGEIVVQAANQFSHSEEIKTP